MSGLPELLVALLGTATDQHEMNIEARQVLQQLRAASYNTDLRGHLRAIRSQEPWGDCLHCKTLAEARALIAGIKGVPA